MYQNMMDLMRRGSLPSRGFIRQEQVDLGAFLATEFGRLYRDGSITRHEAAA